MFARTHVTASRFTARIAAATMLICLAFTLTPRPADACQAPAKEFSIDEVDRDSFVVPIDGVVTFRARIAYWPGGPRARDLQIEARRAAAAPITGAVAFQELTRNIEQAPWDETDILVIFTPDETLEPEQTYELHIEFKTNYHFDAELPDFWTIPFQTAAAGTEAVFELPGDVSLSVNASIHYLEDCCEPDWCVGIGICPDCKVCWTTHAIDRPQVNVGFDLAGSPFASQYLYRIRRAGEDAVHSQTWREDEGWLSGTVLFPDADLGPEYCIELDLVRLSDKITISSEPLCATRSEEVHIGTRALPFQRSPDCPTNPDASGGGDQSDTGDFDAEEPDDRTGSEELLTSSGSGCNTTTSNGPAGLTLVLLLGLAFLGGTRRYCCTAARAAS